MTAFNDIGYNVGGYGESPESPNVMPTGLLVFNGFDCNDGVYMLITDVPDIENAPEREIDVISVPRAPGVTMVNDNTRGKIITARGVVRAADGPSLRAYIDTIKKSLRGSNGVLTVTWQGITRRYVGTLQNTGSMFSGKLPTDINKCPFELQFLTEGLATDWDYTQTSKQITSLIDTADLSNAGTTEAESTVILVFNDAVGITSMQVSVDENGQAIKYTGTISAGDVLVFDGENQTVTLNGVEVNFSGFFPQMDVGANTFRFTATGTSLDFRATILTKNAYL